MDYWAGRKVGPVLRCMGVGWCFRCNKISQGTVVLRPYRGFQGNSGAGVVMYVDSGSTVLAVSGGDVTLMEFVVATCHKYAVAEPFHCK